MARTSQMITSGCISLQSDGAYRLFFGVKDGCRSFSAAWDAEDVLPAGALTLTFDGNPGDPPAVIDLANADNALSFNVVLPLVDVDVAGLPAGGRVILYFR